MNTLDKSKTQDLLLKILIIGDTCVGKSCLLLSFIKDLHSAEYKPTIGLDLAIKTIELYGMIIKIQMWDTAGQERYRALTNNYYNGADAVIVVYDVNNRESFDNVRSWINNIIDKAKPNVQKILIGNKIDKKCRMVSTDEGNTIAKEFKMSFFETSTKYRRNNQNIFQMIAENLVIQHKKSEKDEIKKDSIFLKKNASILNNWFCCI